ncbi:MULTISPECIES: tyrosine-protein phosphatase [Phenylobacterium]|jgi:protein tyrosine/serine phosphatase|uniref:Tyrosine-protein phosphatase n=1 Tax=Phenylobacterium conjunctum TaxID=1298959 RepID=A0ABW3T356_9CAUL
MTARILPLTGVENFRDYGDYAGRGGRVAAGRLYRSAHHGKATSEDLAVIGGLGLAAVVDLRRPMERDAEPTPRPPGFAGQVIECDLGDRAEAPHVAFLRETDLTPDSVTAFFMDYYAHAPFEPRHLELFRRYFEALVTVDGPVLIHCTAGKDRTGLLAALTHHVLGVAHDDIIADYLLTNQAARLEARAPTVAENLEKMLGKRPSDVAVHAFLGVEAAYLERALQAIVEARGSLDAYLADLGLDAAAAETLRARLIS